MEGEETLREPLHCEAIVDESDDNGRSCDLHNERAEVEDLVLFMQPFIPNLLQEDEFRQLQWSQWRVNSLDWNRKCSLTSSTEVALCVFITLKCAPPHLINYVPLIISK